MTPRSIKHPSGTGRVFVSHTGVDEHPAHQLAEHLRRNGIPVWFDKDDLAPGDQWMPALETAVRDSSAMIVYVGRLGVQTWVDREVRLGLELNTKDPEAFRLIPVLGEGSEPAQLPPFLSQQHYIDLRDTQQFPEQIRRLVEILRAPTAVSAIPSEYWETHSPFRSLRVFEPSDAWLFFGREAETEKLLSLLGNAPVLAVLGNSGSGKSSLIQAGLIPALRRGRFRYRGSPVNSWRIAVFRPSNDPFNELAETLPGQLDPDLSPRDRTELISYYKGNLQLGNEGLRNSIAAIAKGSHTLLVADQFEELFTLTNDTTVRARYIDALLTAARVDGVNPVHLVLGIRADFYAHCLDHGQLSRLLEGNLLNVPRMEMPRLRESIEQRLALAATRAESGLIDSLLAEVGEEPGNLALLEHALGQLWEKRGPDGNLTNHAYQGIGRLRGALGRHADQVLNDIDKALQPLVTRVFLDLVQLGEGAQDTRRRVPKKELLRLASREQVERLLDRLASDRLIIASDDIVEVSHETLIREWPKLREWLAKNREDLRLERGLGEAANEWARSNRDASYLLHGARLAQAEEWFTRHSDTPALVAEYLKASLNSRDENARRSERSARRTRWFAYAFGLLFLLSTAAAILALRERVRATTEQREAQARELAAYSVDSIPNDLERSILLGMQAVYATVRFGQAAVPAAEDALHRAIMSSPLRLSVRHPWPKSVAFSRDGQRLATAGWDNMAKTWDVATGKELRTFRGHLSGVLCVAFSPDGRLLATASADKTAKLWDAIGGQELLTLRGHSDSVTSVAFSPDSRLLATASLDETAKVWNPATGQELLTLRGHSGWVNGVAFSPDSRYLATANNEETAKVWDAVSGRELRTLRGHTKSVESVAFSPDGKLLATASTDRTAKVWDAATGRPLRTLNGHTEHILSVAFSSDGKRLATGGLDTAKVWDSSTGQHLRDLNGSGAVVAIAFSADGRYLATGSQDERARVWSTSDIEDMFTLRSRDSDSFGSLAFTPDGRRLAAAGRDNTVRVWDSATGREILKLPANNVVDIAFSPDGQRLATATWQNTARIWDSFAGRELLTLGSPSEQVNSVAFSPDGGRLFTADDGGSVKWWDFSTGQELGAFQDSESIRSMALSRNGKWIATANSNTGGLWDATTGRELLTFHCGNVFFKAAFSPDGRRLAAACWDGARLWDTSSGREMFTFKGHEGVLYDVAFSPDGRRLATASSDKTVKLWDITTGRELFTLRGHTENVTSVAFSPDGKRLASAGTDGTVQVYAIDIYDLLALARGRVGRSLTPDECKRYFQTQTCPAIP